MPTTNFTVSEAPASSTNFNTIQAAVDAALAGTVITVAAGTYTENVVIGTSGISIVSSGGRDATSIIGTAGSSLGTIVLTPGVNDVVIGGIDTGFTVVGFDGTPGIETSAIYLQGAHSNITVQGNDVVANGDGGLQGEFNAALINLTIDSNIFSGQTFVGPNPGGSGFNNQFTEFNVPRQLVVLGGSDGNPASNVVFTNNQVTGSAGGLNAEGLAQGNTLVTIDVANTVISDNDFTGFTNRFATQLRVRDTNTAITDNTFENATGNVGLFTQFGAGEVAGPTSNTYVYGAGDNVIVATAGNNIIDGGAGTDTLVMTNAGASGSIVDLQTGQAFSTATGPDLISNIENIAGSAGNDILSGDAMDNVFFATAGNDVMDGRGGSDTLNASSATAAVTANLDADAGSVSGAFVVTTLKNVENIVTGSGGDTVSGSAANNSITTGAGNDVVNTSAGTDSIDGGTGSDLIDFTGERADYTITWNGTQATVTNIATGDVSTITSAETLTFADKSVLLVSSTSEVFATIQSAVDSAATGDEVLVANGTYSETVTVTDKAIAIIGAGTEVVLTGTILVSDDMDATDVLRLTNIGIDATGQIYGLRVSSSSADVPGVNGGKIVLDGVTIENAGAAGFYYAHPANDGSPTNVNTIGTVEIIDSVFEGNGEIFNGSRGNGHVSLFGFNGNLTIDGSTFTGPATNLGDSVFTGDTAQGTTVSPYKAIQVVGVRTGTPGVGGYITAGDLVIHDTTVTGFYSSDVLAFYTIESFASVSFENAVVNARGLFGLVNFDSVGGTVDLTGLSGTNAATGLPLGVLQGLAGADALTGTAGTDSFIGRGGADNLQGAAGDDTFFYLSAGDLPAGETIDGGLGSDTVLFASAVASTLVLNANTTGIETAVISSQTGANNTPGLNGIAMSLDASAVGNGLMIGGNDAANTLTSTAFDDTVVANGGNDTVNAGAGNDTVFGGAGDDQLFGGTGDDVLTGGAGADILIGGAGVNTASYAAAGAGIAVSLLAGTGSAGDATGDILSNIGNLTGSAFDDTLTGDNTDNQIDGGAGNDSIVGGGGDDLLDGGAGSDVIDGGVGSDEVIIDADYADVTITRTGDTYTIVNAELETTTTVSGVETFTFNDQSVSVTGNADAIVTAAPPSIVSILEAGTDEDMTAATVAVAENSAAATAVATVTATDPNLAVGGTLSYALVDAMGNAYTGPFSITKTPGVETTASITLTGALNFEATPSVDLIVKVTDSTGLSVTQNVTVTVLDINEPITAVTLGNAMPSVDENAVGASIATVNVADPDADETFSYTVSDNRFEVADIDGTATLKLKSGISLNFETTASVSVMITATDSAMHSLSNTFTIAVNDVNEAPVVGADWAPGGIEAGTRSGDLFPEAIVTDPEADTLTYTLDTAPTAGALLLNGDVVMIGDTLTLAELQALTYQAGETAGAFSAVFSVSDGDLTSPLTLNLTVTAAVNGTLTGTAAGDYLDGAAGNDTIDGLAGDDTVYAGSGDDLIIGGNGNNDIYGGAGFNTVSYAQAGSAVEVSLGIEGPDAGMASTSESDQGDTLQGIRGIIGSAFEDSISGGTNAESLDGGAGDDVISGGDGNDTLVGGAGDDSLNGGSGDNVLTGGAGTDTAEFRDSFRGLTITRDGALYTIAGEGGTTTVSGVETFIFDGVSVSVVDNADAIVSAAPPTITSVVEAGADEDENPATIQILETPDAFIVIEPETMAFGPVEITGEVIALVTANDPNLAVDEELSFSLVDAEGNLYEGPFAVLQVSDRTANILVTGPINFETTPTETFFVRVTDSTGNSTDQTVTINILDVNEPITNLVVESEGPSVNENAVGAVIAPVVVEDPDANDTFTFDVSDSRFEVRNVLGGGFVLALKAGQSLNFEAETSVDLTITATDGAEHSLSTEVTVAVNNVNEAPGIGATPAIWTPGSIEAGSRRADLSPEAGVSDPEGSTVSYTLSSGPSAGRLFLGTSVVTVGTILSETQLSDLRYEAGQNAGTFNAIFAASDGVMSSPLTLRLTVTAAVSEDYSGTAVADFTDTAGGNDALNGLRGNDTLFGGSGRDLIYGGAGNEFVNGGDDRDSIYGGSGVDLIYGGADDDIVDGGRSTDRLDGQSGNDTIYGGGDEDVLFGGAGNDVLVGGTGGDEMGGGAGADTFVFNGRSEIAAGETIIDFKAGVDTIDLSVLDANLGAIFDQAFTFIGGAAFSSTAGELRYVRATGLLSGDQNGDGTAEFTLELSNNVALTQNDFIL